MAARGILVLCGSLIALGIMEGYFDLLDPQPFESYPSGDSYGFPDFSLGRRFDSPAFDGVKLSESDTGRYRVLGIGDSFMEVFLGPELQRRVAASFADKAVFMNAGVGSYGVGQELQLYRSRWRSSRPNLVLLSLYIGNDFYDDVHYEEFLKGRRFWMRLHCARCLVRMYKALPGLMRARRLTRPRAAPEAAPGKDAEYKFYLKKELPIFVAGEGGFSAWAATLNDVRDMRDLTRSLDAKFAVVLIPRDIQAETANVRKLLDRDVDASALDMGLPNRKLREFLDHERIPFLDLLPILRRHVGPKPLYRYADYDIHWTEEGTRIAADATMRWLESSHQLDVRR